jgi:hypothetical protein
MKNERNLRNPFIRDALFIEDGLASIRQCVHMLACISAYEVESHLTEDYFNGKAKILWALENALAELAECSLQRVGHGDE